MTPQALDTSVPVIRFNQFARDDNEDLLYLFAAKAKDVARWAGVPRKGWKIRMLYQRWVTEGRQNELADFWDRAATGDTVILGPTAITVALLAPVPVDNGQFRMTYQRPVELAGDNAADLKALAEFVFPVIRDRLSESQTSLLDNQAADPFSPFPDVEHDYVFEFGLQLTQMVDDAERFIEVHRMSDDEARDLITSLEALCRPALVVDGQHRLLGAAACDAEVVLPVIAMPNSNWVEQIYQFIVINEKAQKVDPSLLTDIFGSSLTKSEQATMRDRLQRARVDVEARIAAVVANRDVRSPFYQMVKLNIGGAGAPSTKAYVTDKTIRLLIDGTTRHSRAWRSDDEFYEELVKPIFPERPDWDTWTSGAWRSYWFKFWATVRDYYNERADREQSEQPTWTAGEQTNLTKAVTLRVLQKLFIDKMVAHMQSVKEMSSILEEELGPEKAEKRMESRILVSALPADLDQFSVYVIDRFLKYMPVRIFLKTWRKSLDDDEGRQIVYDELEEAYNKLRKGDRYRAQNVELFSTEG